MNGASEAEALSRMGMEMATNMATQVFRVSLNGSVFVIKAVGKPVLNFLSAAVYGEGKTAGKTRLANLLRSGKPLKIYTFREDQMKDFISMAKRYGIVYSTVRRDSEDKNNSVYDIMVKAEDAPKINRVFEKMNYATVDATLTAEETTDEKSMNIQYIHELIDKVMQPGVDAENPLQAVEGEYLYTASSTPENRPSVMEQINKAKEVVNEINSKQSQNPYSQLINQLMEPGEVEEESDYSVEGAVAYQDEVIYQDDVTENLKKEHYNEIVEKDISSPNYDGLAQKIRDTLGIRRKTLTESESKYLNMWVNTYGFSDELILHACDKASTAKPNSVNFAYVNGILENWNKHGVKTTEDVDKLEISFVNQRRQSSSKYQQAYAKAFNNFEQTKLDDELAEMEELFHREVNGI